MPRNLQVRLWKEFQLQNDSVMVIDRSNIWSKLSPLASLGTGVFCFQRTFFFLFLVWDVGNTEICICILIICLHVRRRGFFSLLVLFGVFFSSSVELQRYFSIQSNPKVVVHNTLFFEASEISQRRDQRLMGERNVAVIGMQNLLHNGKSPREVLHFGHKPQCSWNVLVDMLLC